MEFFSYLVTYKYINFFTVGNYNAGENDWVEDYLESHDVSYENNRLNALDSLDNSWAEEYLITSEQDIQWVNHIFSADFNLYGNYIFVI